MGVIQETIDQRAHRDAVPFTHQRIAVSQPYLETNHVPRPCPHHLLLSTTADNHSPLNNLTTSKPTPPTTPFARLYTLRTPSLHPPWPTTSSRTTHTFPPLVQAASRALRARMATSALPPSKRYVFAFLYILRRMQPVSQTAAHRSRGPAPVAELSGAEPRTALNRRRSLQCVLRPT